MPGLRLAWAVCLIAWCQQPSDSQSGYSRFVTEHCSCKGSLSQMMTSATISVWNDVMHMLRRWHPYLTTFQHEDYATGGCSKQPSATVVHHRCSREKPRKATLTTLSTMVVNKQPCMPTEKCPLCQVHSVPVTGLHSVTVTLCNKSQFLPLAVTCSHQDAV